ncbi:c-type cytochrome [Sphingomicrobium lutaoense]|uniref:Mono/diheme cytochrome c family protein n=1 Tax=Sphingomicrobium lutaoense TaxID=515949 RepID=A0A839YY84_9SPHN|nr:c-type cytochrome [Sphingomicrobium lutaoense]MBB3764109.1 mono/diheme cytochrome c family protein [Sphingomicrobium lutaoense]
MKNGIAIIVAVGLAAAGCNYALEDRAIPLAQASFDGASGNPVRHGERLGTVLGCNSCHGADYQGGSYSDDPDGGFIFASNLTRRVSALGDRELEALLREGVHPRRDALWYMPARTLQRLSDRDMKALIAFLRTLRPAGRDWPLPADGPATEALLGYGILDKGPAQVKRYAEHMPPDRGAALAKGRYIAAVTCAECHGAALGGGTAAPPIDRIAEKGREQLAMVLRTGTRPDGSAHGVMRYVAARNLSALTERENEALLDYLMTLGDARVSE